MQRWYFYGKWACSIDLEIKNQVPCPCNCASGGNSARDKGFLCPGTTSRKGVDWGTARRCQSTSTARDEGTKHWRARNPTPRQSYHSVRWKENYISLLTSTLGENYGNSTRCSSPTFLQQVAPWNAGTQAQSIPPRRAHLWSPERTPRLLAAAV